MRWTLHNNLLTMEMYNWEATFKLFFDTEDTPLEATKACTARWREFYQQSSDLTWSDTFIAGT